MTQSCSRLETCTQCLGHKESAIRHLRCFAAQRSESEESSSQSLYHRIRVDIRVVTSESVFAQHYGSQPVWNGEGG